MTCYNGPYSVKLKLDKGEVYLKPFSEFYVKNNTLHTKNKKYQIDSYTANILITNYKK